MASVVSPGHNLNQSKDFYTSLDFSISVTTDGFIASANELIISVEKNVHIRPGIRLYQVDWSQKVNALAEHTIVHKTEDGHILGDGNGNTIYLSTAEKPSFVSKEENSSLGGYAGLSIESLHFARSIKIYEALGFEIVQGSPESSWLVMVNKDKLGVSLMKHNTCPHLFFNPSLTFFNGGKNMPVIEKIRSAGIPIAEEITVFNEEGIVDNVIIRDPGGLGMFVFND